MNLFLNRFFINFLGILLFTVPTFLFAQDVGIKNPLQGVDNISSLILIVTRVVRYVAIPFVVIMIMYVGFLFIWAQIQPKTTTLQDAKKALIYVFLGTFLILSSELMAVLVKNTLDSFK